VRPVSAAFLRTIRGSHTMIARARVVASGQSGVAPVGTEVAIEGGNVALDATAQVRSTLDLTIDGTAMWPTTAANPLLGIAGKEIFVERGVTYGSGQREWVSLGYHRVDTIGQDEAPDGPIRITGSDRMATIVDAKLIQPRQFTAATTLGAVVANLINEVFPAAGIEWDDATSANTLGTAQVTTDDRYGFLNDLITAQGKIWYWDYRGVLVIKDPPSPVNPVYDINAGPGGVLVKAGRELTRDGMYNAVVATGEGADNTAPVWAIAYDNNPASPTYFGSGISGGAVVGAGPFGPVPSFYTSPLLQTAAQAQKAASNLLLQLLGQPYSMDLTAVPNCALEPYDPVRVIYPARARSYAQVTETHILQTLSVPLVAADAMTASTRQQTLVQIGTATA
jgi:Domain of unknown function (DUF5047)